MPPTIQLANYLFTRLKQLGVQSIHGVPGDYNLALLDYVSPQGLRWVGNCNELNAGYATDAYSRIKGLGAVITTFGVGELSAANAIAGAYTELVPMVHIVGTPARKSQDERAIVHHTLADGEYRHFARMATHITVSQAMLEDPRLCPEQIDTTIRECLVQSRPVYIALPADMISVLVDAKRLEKIIEFPKPVSSNEEAAAIGLVLERMYSCQQPMILVDGESRAYGILEELHNLITSTQWPTWTTIFGKSCIDESLPNFKGIWQGVYATNEDSKFIKSCDLVMCFGPHFSNTNTYGYTSVPDPKITIHFTATAIRSCEKVFRDLPAKHVLSLLLAKLDTPRAKKQITYPAAATNGIAPRPSPPSADGLLTQELFYKTFSQYLRPGDIILAETGTAGHGCRDFHLPPHTFLFKPSTWLSIGYMLPATQGAALAQQELTSAGEWHKECERAPRTVLLIGDGSFQMTAQELSTIIKLELNVLLILINNNGYTIERCLHGYKQAYNDIAFWRYLRAPAFFGASEKGAETGEYRYETDRVQTWGELEEVMKQEENDRGEVPILRMVEVVMGKEDAPFTLMASLNRQKAAAAVK